MVELLRTSVQVSCTPRSPMKGLYAPCFLCNGVVREGSMISNLPELLYITSYTQSAQTYASRSK